MVARVVFGIFEATPTGGDDCFEIEECGEKLFSGFLSGLEKRSLWPLHTELIWPKQGSLHRIMVVDISFDRY
jgi:hypothetical protein